MKTSVARARRLIARPEAWLDTGPTDGTYALRLGPGRCRRAVATLDEVVFRDLVKAPGLRRRPSGLGSPLGIVGRRRPGGRRSGPDRRRPRGHGRGRTGPDRARQPGSEPPRLAGPAQGCRGRPWLTPSERTAGERLRRDAEIALSGPSVTMRWDALPRSGGSSAARVEPGDRAMGAGRRVAAALAACGPQLAPFLVQICIRETALQAAERALGVPARRGKRVLKAGLQALAGHYGID